MIKNMPDTAKQHLAGMFNKFYKYSFFPIQWNTAIVTTIPKPGKDHTNPSKYRQIALTSCLCKTFERLINDRLLDYLEVHMQFATIQCGCRRNKSTTDHLVPVENQLRTAFAKGEHFISVFFNIEKTYDMTWRYSILKNLYDMGLRGYLSKYIAQFLKIREFKVKVKNFTTDSYLRQNRIPQGSVLSIIISSLAAVIPNNTHFLSSLYLDDLQVGMRHVNL